MRKFLDLNPSWTGLTRADSGEGVAFDCPICGPSHRCCAYFSNPLDGQPPAAWQKPVWERQGDALDGLTLSPSIQYACFHGWIEKGFYIDVSESPMILLTAVNGEYTNVSLSPLQALNIVNQVQQRCIAMEFPL